MDARAVKKEFAVFHLAIWYICYILNERVKQTVRTFDAYLSEKMNDPEFRTKYDALEAEYAIIDAIIEARKSSKLTQKQLSEKTGIAQGDISKIERGIANPSIKTLKTLASGMDMKIKLEFVPINLSQAP